MSSTFNALNTILSQGSSTSMTLPGSGGDCKLKYPLVGNPKDYPLHIQFLARRYETKALARYQHMTPDPNAGDNLAAIQLPLPVELTNNVSANYQEQIYQHRFGIKDITPAELAEDFATGGGLLGKGHALFSGGIGAFLESIGRDVYYNYIRDELGIAEFHGEVPMDLRDAIFSSMQFRTFTFSWLFVPKNTREAERVAKICNTFNTLLHPMRNTTVQLATRAIHPCMWNISVYDLDGTQGNRHRWIPYPQLSVLQQCQIRTRMSENGPWTLYSPDSNGHWPAATMLGLTFVEMEPNIAVTNDACGNSKIISRSGYLNNSGLGAGGGAVYDSTQGEL